MAFELAAGEVHAWRFSLGDGGPQGYGLVLTEDDAERAARFVFERDRARFLRARHALRHLLGSYLGIDPRNLPILYSRHGKPWVDARYRLGFNMSHSGDHGLIAFARSEHVGVDIEEVSRRENLRDLAPSVFTQGELHALRDVPDAQFPVAFLTCWTRKEACLKALGVGLTLKPRDVHVGTRPVRERVTVAGAPAPAEVEVESLFEDQHCVAALAVGGGFTRSTILSWEP